MHAESGPTPAPFDLEPHLALVTHVVRQLSARVPAHVDREAMWVHGALGLVLAAHEHSIGRAPMAFGTRAMRSIRNEVLAGLRRGAPLPSTADLAELLGTTPTEVARHRDVLARPSAPAAAAATPAPMRERLPRTPAWMPAPA